MHEKVVLVVAGTKNGWCATSYFGIASWQWSTINQMCSDFYQWDCTVLNVGFIFFPRSSLEFQWFLLSLMGALVPVNPATTSHTHKHACTQKLVNCPSFYTIPLQAGFSLYQWQPSTHACRCQTWLILPSTYYIHRIQSCIIPITMFSNFCDTMFSPGV